MRVLATKLRPPPPRADLVPRPRLQDHLTAGDSAGARLFLLSAPAGFGKTTVLSQWLWALGTGAPSGVAWVSLDAGDNDARRFLAHLVAAVRATNSEVGGEAAVILEAPSEVPVEAVLTSLVNDLDTLAGPTVIALDDFHEVTAPALHEALGFLVDHLPHHVRLAVTTRADPSLPLARLRSAGGLVELRAAELRFNPEEAHTLLNDVTGLALQRGDVEALDERTEGWAAGLQLAALSMRGREDLSAFVDAFAGSHRFVLDYLVEEVLERQPEGVRDFLLDTSVLRRMTAPLCAAVTGRTDAQTMLAWLDRTNVFVVPLDDRRAWYRYHHLFADALQARLTSSDPARVDGLHRRASRWYAEHGAVDDALVHAAAGGDHQGAADLVELALPALRRARHDDTIRSHLGLLPADVLRHRPLLATAMAWSRLAHGDLTGVEAWLDDAERSGGSPTGVSADLRAWLPEATADRETDVRQLPAMAAVYRASVAQARGDVAGTTALARRALELAGPDDHVSRGAAAGFLGLASWAAGDVLAAVDTFVEAVGALRAAGNVADELGATVVLAAMWLGRGRPDEARRLLERALVDAGRHAGPLPTAGDLHVALADVLREQGELGTALEHLETARLLGDAGSLPEHRHRWFSVTAGVLAAQGDHDGALGLLGRAASLYQPGFLPDLHPIPAVRTRILVCQGRLGEAAAWARATGVTVAGVPSYLDEFDRLTLARLVVAEIREMGLPGRTTTLDDLLVMLEGILDSARAAGRTGSVVEAGMVRALALAARGDAAAARAGLASALSLGVPAGYRRLFLDEGPPIVELLHDLVSRPGGPDVAGDAARLLLLAGQTPGPFRSLGPAAGSLSDRELQVLRLLATDLSGPEIARHLFVSVNTLRTHTKHIFTKLGVSTRRAAVRTAAELDLLGGPRITT